MKTRLILLALACLLVAAPATAQVNYGISGNTAYVAYSPGASGDIVIASTYNGYPVTAIGGFAFTNCTSLTSVTIPNSVTSILYYAFTRCTSLTNMTIPNSVTSIGYRAFRECWSLRSVNIPPGVTSIEPDLIGVCTNLTNISVDAANPAYSSLDGVLFNKAQTTLIAFPGGRGSYVMPDGVTNIGDSAFSYCSLTNVTIANSVTSISDWAFFRCTSLKSLTIGNSVTSIGGAAFLFCGSLTNFTFLGNAPSHADTTFASVGVGAKVYYYCGTTGWGTNYGGLPTVMLCPPQVNYAVSGNTAYVAYSPNASGDIVIASTYNGYPVTSIGGYAFGGCTDLTSVTIPNSVTVIGILAFTNCTSLTSVTIPNSVARIGGFAFSRCTRLTSVTIGNSVTDIEYEAFAYCTSLTNVIIGNSVTSMGRSVFYGCTSLTSVTIPASVTSIGQTAFTGCTSLTNFTFLGNAPGLVPGAFSGVGAGAKVYYYCGTTGWGATYGYLPTVMLCPPQIAPGSAGVKPDGFGFTLTRLTNQTIVVEASTNLLNWQPIWTNPPPGTSVEFVDPEWLQHSNRFYRARSD